MIQLFYNYNQNFVFFDDIALVNKTELDFSLILCDAICDQCIYFLFIVRSTKNGRESNEVIKG